LHNRSLTYLVPIILLLSPVIASHRIPLQEFVRDGGSLRVLLLDSMTYISFSLAGILCPRLNSGSKAQSQSQAQSEGAEGAASASASTAAQPEPFALQARHFTELRLLNREMDVVMQSLDRTGNVLGTVLHPKGNIAVEIVKAGLAKVADRSLTVVTK
jgi:staphylococcal nuclease domain-containing protein 1